MQLVTIWCRHSMLHGMRHNHIENGLSKLRTPTPMCDHQRQAWAKQDWFRYYGFLDANNVLHRLPIEKMRAAIMNNGTTIAQHNAQLRRAVEAQQHERRSIYDQPPAEARWLISLALVIVAGAAAFFIGAGIAEFFRA